MGVNGRVARQQVAVARVTVPPAVVLFLVMFAAQASILVLSPLLPALAADLGVSTAAAGQLRAASGAVAGTAALVFAAVGWSRGLRSVLLAGVGLLAAGAAASAAAPSFALLVAAQAPVGVGLALALAGALAAAAQWAPRDRARLLAWALAGQPAAWIVGMPLAGAVGELGWRHAWLALPFAASLAALAALGLLPRDAAAASAPAARSPWREPGVRRWAVGELCAYAAWSGVLIYAGALFIQSYGLSPAATGLVLATAAGAYLSGTFLARRLLARSARPLLATAALASAPVVAALGGVRAGTVWTATLLCLLAVLAAARTIAASSHGLDLAPARRLGLMSIRAACLQYGYLLGAGLGGAALATGGFTALGIVLSVLFALAALPHLSGATLPATANPAAPATTTATQVVAR